MDISNHSRNSHFLRKYRSRSPSVPVSPIEAVDERPHYQHHHRSDRNTRSRSPKRKGRNHLHGRRREYERESERPKPASQPRLPLSAMPLSLRDQAYYEPIFGMYLDIQKNLDLADLGERELKGRWKGFVGRWNRGELAEGWYDPSALEKARNSTYATRRSGPHNRSPCSSDREPHGHRQPPSLCEGGESESTMQGALGRLSSPALQQLQDEESADELQGPQPPEVAPSTLSSPNVNSRRKRQQKFVSTVPGIQDLQLRRDVEKSSLVAAHAAHDASRILATKALGYQHRAFEDEIAPRADPGTRERRVEKRRQIASSNLAFAQSYRGGSPTEAAPDAELMGDGVEGGDLAALKCAREREVRKKNEREIRREEILRARAAEREERLKTYRRKEEETMGVLKALAKQRFG